MTGSSVAVFCHSSLYNHWLLRLPFKFRVVIILSVKQNDAVSVLLCRTCGT